MVFRTMRLYTIGLLSWASPRLQTSLVPWINNIFKPQISEQFEVIEFVHYTANIPQSSIMKSDIKYKYISKQEIEYNINTICNILSG